MSGTMDEEFTPDELAYINSRGSEFGATPGSAGVADPAQQTPAPSPAPVATSSQEGEQQPSSVSLEDHDDDDETDEEVVVLGKDGKYRGANGKFVSHKALHREREKRKAAQSDLAKERDRNARVEERLAILNEAFSTGTQQKPSASAPAAQAQAPQNPYEEPSIDPESDFMGWAKQMQRRSEWNFNTHKQTQESQSTRDNFQRLTHRYHEDAKSYIAKDPTFKDAYSFLVGSRHRELAALGVTDQKEREKQIAQEETAIVVQAFEAGKSPAQVLHEYARARGFSGTAAPASQGGAPSAQHLTPAPSAQNAAERIAHLRNGQNAAQSLSNGSGAHVAPLTYERLANMSDDDFENAVAGLSKAQLTALMGA